MQASGRFLLLLILVLSRLANPPLHLRTRTYVHMGHYSRLLKTQGTYRSATGTQCTMLVRSYRMCPLAAMTTPRSTHHLENNSEAWLERPDRVRSLTKRGKASHPWSI